MIRTIITPDNQDLYLHIPQSFVGKKIEVIALTIDEADVEPKKMTMADFWGTISDDTAAELQKAANDGRNDWEERINKQI